MYRACKRASRASSASTNQPQADAVNELPIAIFWGAALWSFFGSRNGLLYLFFGSMPFGAFAVVPPEFLGGLTLTPTPMVAILLIVRMLANNAGFNYLLNTASSRKIFLYLILFWLVAVIVTMFAPRLFAGQVLVIPVRDAENTLGSPLYPTVQNFSQLAYLSVSVFCVIAVSRYLYKYVALEKVYSAIYFGSGMLILSGVLDYLNQYVNLNPLLEPFRTATYSLLTSAESLGTKRVVGLMPEASAFGTFCIFFLTAVYFITPVAAPGKFHTLWRQAHVSLLILMAVISTSSAATAGLLVFFALVIVQKMMPKNGYWKIGIGFLVQFAVVLGLLALLAFSRELQQVIFEFLDEIVFRKSQSSSYEERSMWTAVGWQALSDTYGIGVGIGGTRTSNSLAAIMSNTGILGGCLYYLFVVQTLGRRIKPTLEWSNLPGVQRGLLLAFIPSFVVYFLVGTVADFGVGNAFIFGMSIALMLKQSKGHMGTSQVPAPTLRAYA